MNRGALATLALLTMVGSASADAYIISRLKSGVNPNAVASSYGIKLVDYISGGPFAYFKAPNSDAADLAEAKMATDTRVVWAEDDAGMGSPEPQKGSTLPAVGDRLALYQANGQFLSQINWNTSLALKPGRRIIVAILDTGLSPNQPYLWAKVDDSINVVDRTQPAYDLPGNTDTNKDGVYDGMTGHGTMVAGVLDQISPQSRFVIARVADSDGVATAWSVIKGLSFAVKSGAEVANVSLGTLNDIPAMSDVLEWCASKNMLVVAAIGNNAQPLACNPARISDAVCVGGLLPNSTKAPFSNWNSACLVSAPATGIVSQDWTGKMANWSGTSFSTPMVSGAVAEALRLNTTVSVPTSRTRKLLKRLGSSLDTLNPTYAGKLGMLLDFNRFVSGYRP
jgi:hypothetical protein